MPDAIAVIGLTGQTESWVEVTRKDRSCLFRNCAIDKELQAMYRIWRSPSAGLVVVLRVLTGCKVFHLEIMTKCYTWDDRQDDMVTGRVAEQDASTVYYAPTDLLQTSILETSPFMRWNGIVFDSIAEKNAFMNIVL